ncbi:hypothetical protein [Brevundimonas naejangsanensis]|uniref:hypothetical protein n=1 Tax=Brevundimonas naejangsanensis TaxID=588932 RepID=UPI001068DB5E|nr:hypothetical protein [Brevundimonas naejangsanensis]QBQ48363.1 hypothetical protein E3U41_06455 [Brevundimonas naejangsanensis]
MFAQPKAFTRFITPQEENETVSGFGYARRIVGVVSMAFVAMTFAPAPQFRLGKALLYVGAGGHECDFSARAAIGWRIHLQGRLTLSSRDEALC